MRVVGNGSERAELDRSPMFFAKRVVRATGHVPQRIGRREPIACGIIGVPGYSAFRIGFCDRDFRWRRRVGRQPSFGSVVVNTWLLAIVCKRH